MHVRAFTNYSGTVLLGAADTEILTLLSALRFINNAALRLNETVIVDGQEVPSTRPRHDTVITSLYRWEDFASNRSDVP